MTNHRDQIDFVDLAAALLRHAERLVPQWLPGGRMAGREYVCASLSGGEGSSCSVNLDTGVWADFAGDDRGGDLTSLYAAIHGLNNAQAAREIMRSEGWEKRGVQTPAPTRSSAIDDEPASVEPAATPGKRDSVWKPILPVPPDTPRPTFKHFHRGDPAFVWEYRFEGELHGYVCRFETSDGGKEILPYTWCEDTGDDRRTRKWSWKQWDDPRPLYVPATLLSADLSLPIVIVEGEKCALAGHQLLGHEFDFVSWPGGGKAWQKSRWSMIMGRTVYLWPDCDAKRHPLTPDERKDNVDPATKALKDELRQPGVAAMVGIGQELMAQHGCTVFLCPVPKPGAVADGWDIADAIAQGWDAETVRAFIRGAKPFVAPDNAARAKASAEKHTPSMAGAKPRDESDAWRSSLLTSPKGAIERVRDNLVLALDGVPGAGVAGVQEAAGVIAFNEFTNNVEKLKPAPWGTAAGVWDEEDELEMGAWLTREHLLPSMSRATLEESVLMVSKRHRFHPVRARVLKLRNTWDQTRRAGSWIRRCCLIDQEVDEKSPLEQYLARVGTWLLMGMVARVLPLEKDGSRTIRGPGTKFDNMVIFEGNQGVGKSTLASVLAGDHYADTGLVLGEKDSYQNLQGIWIYEWGELDSLNRGEVTKVKNFVASQKDRFRASFDRRPKDYPRQVVFIGTTNEVNYLSDLTGNRRFWPVAVEKQVDIPWLRANLDQLLAEALTYLDAGERFHPTPKEQRELFDPQQQKRTVENPIESAASRYLYDELQKVPHGHDNGAFVNEITLSDLMARLGWSIDKQSPVVMRQGASVMRRLGWDYVRSSAPPRPWLYRRPGVTPAAAAGAAPTTRDARANDQGADEECPF
jgi:putative DNA primase/helicase